MPERIPVHVVDAVRYIKNTGESVTAAQFDDDHKPIGPRLRADVVPRFAAPDATGVLKLTRDGREMLKVAQ